MFKLTLVTPEKKLVLDQELEKIIVPGERGELDILPGHSPLITTLSTGILRWKLRSEPKENEAVISWGYCEIHPDGVDILADIIDFKEDISLEQAQKKIMDNEQRLLNDSLNDADWDGTQREVQRGRAQLELIK